jgi:YbbR domain-containing protein
MGDKNPEENITVDNIPVQLVNVDYLEQDNLALIPNQNFTISLDIKGKALDVYAADDPSQFKVVADLNTNQYLKKGENTIPVKIVATPKNIRVENSTGSQYFIKVNLDSLATKSVPIKIDIVGNAKEGFGYLSAVTKPSEMLVKGPESIVNSVDSVSGQIDINDNSSSVNKSIVIRPLDSQGNEVKNVNLERNVVDVTVPIKPAKDVPIVIRTTGSLAGNKIIKQMNPSYDRVTIIGEKKDIDKIKQIETVIYDVSKINSTYTDVLSLDIPPGVDMFSDIKTVDVEFVVENIVENTVRIPINMINAKDGYNYSMSHTDVTVNIRGAQSVLSAFDSSTISAIVDVSNASEGQNTLGIKLTVPDTVSVASTSPEKVTVTVTKPQEPSTTTTNTNPQ